MAWWPRRSTPAAGGQSSMRSNAGKVSTAAVYEFPWLTTPGTLLFICGLIVMAVYRIAPATAAQAMTATVYRLRWAILTVASVLAFAYVMNLSGQTATIGTWVAGAGAAFAFLSPILLVLLLALCVLVYLQSTVLSGIRP